MLLSSVNAVISIEHKQQRVVKKILKMNVYVRSTLIELNEIVKCCK